MTNKKLILNDITLNYYEKGNPNSESIILLHGNGMSSEHLSKLYNSLDTSKNIISLDIRGCGKSSKGTKEIHIDLIAKDILEFINAKKLTKITIIGYSDGANIAMLLSKLAPQKFNKLILICGNYNLSGICLWFLLLLKIFKYTLKIFSKISLSAKNRLELLNLIFDDMNISENDLKQIQSKTLILYAGIDVIHKKHSLEMNALIPNSKIKLIKRATHENIVRNLDAINTIKSFILE